MYGDSSGKSAGAAGAGREAVDAGASGSRLRSAQLGSKWMHRLTWSVTLGGAAAFVLLWYQLGSHALLAALQAFGRLWPILLVLEVGRGACEVLGTRILLGTAITRVPRLRLLRGQLVAQALDVVMPAGRAAAEAAKAAVYAPAIGLPQAAAIATALQLAVLACNALWVLAGYGVSASLGLPSALRVGLLGYAAATGLLVVGITLFAAAPTVRHWFARVHVLRASLERFAQLLAAAPARLLAAVCAQLLGRSIQALQLMLAASALGAHFSLPQIALTEAVYLVGAALGDLVPAQVGTTDAALVLAAPALGLTPAAAFSVIVALRAVQLMMAAFAAITAYLVSRIEPARQALAPEARPASPTVVKLTQRL